MLSARVGMAASTTPPPADLKTYLSQPPCIEKLIYTDYSSSVPRSKYVVAVHGDDFYIRQVAEKGEVAGRLSSQNRLPLGWLFVGRCGLMRWTIQGFEITTVMGEAIDAPQPDPLAVQVDMLRGSMARVANFGPARILPGTFVWSGNQFRATADALMVRTGPSEFASVRGVVREENGRILELSCAPFGGTYRYEYETTPRLPTGFPARVYGLDPKTRKWIKLFEYHAIVLAAPETIDREVFKPEHHIDPDYAAVTSRSNNVVITQPAPHDPKVVQGALDQLGQLTPHKDRFSRSQVARGLLLLALSLPLLVITINRFRTKTPKTQSHENEQIL
jgi:hypothetical protein